MKEWLKIKLIVLKKCAFTAQKWIKFGELQYFIKLITTKKFSIKIPKINEIELCYNERMYKKYALKS